MKLSAEEVSEWNRTLRSKTAEEILEWAIEHADGQVLVSTSFGPYAAVMLHLCTRIRPEIPVLWVDHGYNRPSTYRHVEELKRRLNLNLKPYLPLVSAAHRDAIHGPVPGPDHEEALRQFSAAMKLEPFQRGVRELAPRVWLTAVRRVQNENRAQLDPVILDANFDTLKVCPLLEWTDDRMESYLQVHQLPNEWDYFDPAKADDHRECGLHAAWGGRVREVEDLKGGGI